MRWVHGSSCQNKATIIYKKEMSYHIDQIRASFYRISCWTNPCIYKKSKITYLTLSISRQNTKHSQASKDASLFCCSLMVLCHCYPHLALTEKEEVVQNIIIKMFFYDLHISSNAQPSILMRNHKKLTENS